MYRLQLHSLLSRESFIARWRPPRLPVLRYHGKTEFLVADSITSESLCANISVRSSMELPLTPVDSHATKAPNETKKTHWNFRAEAE